MRMILVLIHRDGLHNHLCVSRDDCGLSFEDADNLTYTSKRSEDFEDAIALM